MKIKEKDIYKMFNEDDREAVDLIKQMLVFNPSKRITASELVKSEYFDVFRNEEIENDC